MVDVVVDILQVFERVKVQIGNCKGSKRMWLTDVSIVLC